MIKRSVVVTGVGVLTAVARDADTFFSRLLRAESGISISNEKGIGVHAVAQVHDFDPSQYFSRNKILTSDRTTLFASFVTNQALRDGGIDITQENKSRWGVYFGTGMGSANTLEESYIRLYRDRESRLRPYTVLMAMNNSASSQVALDLGIRGPCLTFSTACSSSAVAIGEAMRVIQHDEADVMLAGGAESLLTYGTIKAWDALQTLANVDTQDISASCKPFSLNRTGLVLGEGAAILILEEKKRALRRGAKIYAEIIGYGIANDCLHITQPSVEGQALAMNKALLDAKISAKNLDYINAHGTGTKLNDVIETKSIKEIGAKDVPISSTKSMHGHLMGAAGAVEAVVCLKAIEKQALPPTAHLELPDPECDLDYIPNKARYSTKVKTVMSNSFAFGGTGAVLIMQYV